MNDPHWRLAIGRARSRTLPEPGEAAWKTVRGGPVQLLGWLEDQLGVTGADGVRELSTPARIRRYMTALRTADGDTYRASLEEDPWSTAAELLKRRDELLLAGWEPEDDDNTDELPVLARDLAGAERGFQGPGIPDRLKSIAGRLDAPGTSLPPHRLALDESLDRWPPLWRRVLDRMNVTEASFPGPAATDGSSLHAVQGRLSGIDIAPIELDQSLRWLRAASTHAAVQTVAAAVGGADGPSDHVAIYCPESSTAARLEEAFQRLGRPAVGAERETAASPALQVLPLVLELCWEPVEPQVLMDFLSLPVSPVPAPARWQLARALSETPGLGSREWEEAWDELTTSDADLEERLIRWFDHPRVETGEAVPPDLVRDRCGCVTRWARVYAETLAEEGEHRVLTEQLRTASLQAAELADVVRARGEPLTRPQLLRMLEDVRSSGRVQVRQQAEAGAPWLVTNLADVPPWVEHLVWVGVGVEAPPPSRWTTTELMALREAGIELDDGRRKLQVKREAERRALQHLSSTLLIVELPADEERAVHPLWTRIKTELETDSGDAPEPDPLRVAISEDSPLGAWSVETREVTVTPPPTPPTEWDVPVELLDEPARGSATELESRLACPLRWMLKRTAHIRPSPAARLPDPFRLRGRFAHIVLDDVLGDGGELPEPDEAADAVVDRFDERVTLDAAPLAQPDRLAERRQLRDELEAATRLLVDVLQQGGYEVVRGEAPIDAEYDGRPLGGKIDLVIRGPEGEAIVDFKYGGRSRYRELLEEGHAVQLAVYAYARGNQQGRDGPVSAVGYLVIQPQRLYTPAGSPLRGAGARGVIDGAPAIREVWDRFREALARSQDWLRTEDESVPVRPRQDPDEWPEGVDMVVETDSRKDRTELRPCKYCDYQLLCGVREVT